MMASLLLSAWLIFAPYSCPVGAECRDDFDCGSCSCVDGFCEGYSDGNA